jgi:hypothetical protein
MNGAETFTGRPPPARRRPARSPGRARPAARRRGRVRALRRRGGRRHRAPVAELDLPVGDHALAEPEPRLEDAHRVDRAPHLHRAQSRSPVFADHEGVGPILAHLDRGVGDDGGAALHAELHGDVDELTRPERVVLVGELRLQPDGPGGGIDRVLEEHEGAARLLPARAARARRHRHHARLHPAAELGQVLLGDREAHVNGDQAPNDHQRLSVVRLDDVAGDHQQAAGAAGDGGADLGELDVERGRADPRFRGLEPPARPRRRPGPG